MDFNTLARLGIVLQAICIAEGNVSLEDCDLFTSSFGSSTFSLSVSFPPVDGGNVSGSINSRHVGTAMCIDHDLARTIYLNHIAENTTIGYRHKCAFFL